MTTPPESIGTVFARNLRAARERRRVSVRTLSARLDEIGYPVQATGISRAETEDPAKRRRVTLDELVALAVALGTTPWHLLTPVSRDFVALTPGVQYDGEGTSMWLRGGVEEPVEASRDVDDDEPVRERLQRDSPPWFAHMYSDPSPAVLAVLRLLNAVRAAEAAERRDATTRDHQRADLAQAADRVTAHIQSISEFLASGNAVTAPMLSDLDLALREHYKSQAE